MAFAVAAGGGGPGAAVQEDEPLSAIGRFAPHWQ